MTAANDQQTRVSTGFYLSFLRRRFASSLWAIAETLRRRRERVAATLEYLVNGGSPAALATGAAFEGEQDFEQDDSDAEIIDQLLKNRSEDDLRWELERLGEMLGSSLYDAAPASSKMQALLGYVQQRKDPDRPGRIRQMVIFSQFWDTVEDIVRRFKQVNQKFLIGTYSGRGGQYTDPETGKLVGIEREEIKKRFLRGQVDILVCTDAAAEGLNLQTADYLVNFDLPWNPAKVEQRIGRIDRIGQRHDRHLRPEPVLPGLRRGDRLRPAVEPPGRHDLGGGRAAALHAAGDRGGLPAPGRRRDHRAGPGEGGPGARRRHPAPDPRDRADRPGDLRDLPAHGPA